MQNEEKLKAKLTSKKMQIKWRTLLEASSEEAGHWSDLEKRVNQYEQTQRRASVLNNRLTGGNSWVL